MKLKKVSPDDFLVRKIGEKTSIEFNNQRNRAVISFVHKYIDGIVEPLSINGIIIFNLNRHAYTVLRSPTLFCMNYFQNIDSTLRFINGDGHITVDSFVVNNNDVFYDITDVVKKIKDVKYSENNKSNTDYIKLFKEIALISSYELNKDMNPSKIAYNLGKINSLATNYLENIEN